MNMKWIIKNKAHKMFSFFRETYFAISIKFAFVILLKALCLYSLGFISMWLPLVRFYINTSTNIFGMGTLHTHTYTKTFIRTTFYWINNTVLMGKLLGYIYCLQSWINRNEMIHEWKMLRNYFNQYQYLNWQYRSIRNLFNMNTYY